MAGRSDSRRLREELPSLEDASRLSVDNLRNELSSLDQRVHQLRRGITQADGDLHQRAEAFLLGAQRDLDRVRSTLEGLEDVHRDLSAFLCEDADSFRLEDCFRILSNFCHKLTAAVEENARRQREESAAEARRRLREERLADEPRRRMGSLGSDTADSPSSDASPAGSLQRRRRRPAARYSSSDDDLMDCLRLALSEELSSPRRRPPPADNVSNNDQEARKNLEPLHEQEREDAVQKTEPFPRPVPRPAPRPTPRSASRPSQRPGPSGRSSTPSSSDDEEEEPRCTGIMHTPIPTTVRSSESLVPQARRSSIPTMPGSSVVHRGRAQSEQLLHLGSHRSSTERPFMRATSASSARTALPSRTKSQSRAQIPSRTEPQPRSEAPPRSETRTSIPSRSSIPSHTTVPSHSTVPSSLSSVQSIPPEPTTGSNRHKPKVGPVTSALCSSRASTSELSAPRSRRTRSSPRVAGIPLGYSRGSRV